MDTDDQGSPSPGAALLLIIGEPFSEDHKSLIQEEITKGFRCWDVEESGIDINDELAQIANKASLGEEGANGERLIQHLSDSLSMEILINPLTQSVKLSFKKLLVSPSATKYVIYAGHAFQGTGAWVLQDDVFSFSSLAQVFKDKDVENALKQNIEANLTIHTLADSHWGTNISKADFTNNLRIQLNPPEKLENVTGVAQFTAYVGIFVTHTPITSLLQASEQFGNISFTRPTLYIFPGCQGDSALFGINGFNLLVNGGYNRRACFWEFARHLDRVDAMLLTHLGPDNIFGINTALQRKCLENIHPQIGYLYFNGLDKPGSPSPNIAEAGDGDGEKKCSLLVNLAEEANNLTRMAKQLGITPQPCSRAEKSPNAEPINLYHKLGHGSLDMYALNPITDSKEMKEFYQNWNKKASNLGSSGPFPLQNSLSVCTMLVWRPHNPNEKIVRVLFPGNAPQHKVAEGLEKMKTLAYLKHASCTPKDLQKPVAVKKPSTSSARPGSGTARSARATATARAESSRSSANTSRVQSPRKESSRTSTRSGAVSPTKPPSREVRKRPTNIDTDKAKDTRPSYARSTASSANTTSPRKTPSPTKGATKSPSPVKSPPPAKSPSPSKSATPRSPTKAKSPEKSKPEAKPAAPAESQSEAAAKVPDTNSLDSAAAPQVPQANGSHVDQELKPESDQQPTTQTDQVGASPAVGDSVNGNPQSPDNDSLSSADAASADALSNAMSAAQQKLESLGIYDVEEQKNGQTHTNGDNEEEEVRPQALPEPPVMAASPPPEYMPDYTSKIECDQEELSEFSKVEEELQHLEADTDNTVAKSFEDPAEDIPPSPDPALEEQTDFDDYPAPVNTPLTFDTPVFSNDDPDTGMNGGFEQKIQYGIIDESSRAMEFIQEEDEPEEDGDEVREQNECIEKEDNDREKDLEDNRSSAERQFEDVDDQDEGIQEDVEGGGSSLPAAFDRDSSPEVERNGSKDRDDVDSLDGAVPDDDKDIDEAALVKMNGSMHTDVTSCAHQNSKENGDIQDEEVASFDPVAQWGQPMGLPSPPPASPQKASSARPSSRPGTADAKSRSARGSASTADAKKRPATAPARGGASSRPMSGARRTGTGSNRSSPQSAKVPPMPPMTAFYLDLTYIPNHGDPLYSDLEFFKRVRARYYVLSALSPNLHALDSLMEAKATWEQKDLEVTLIPTYDNETLRHWVGLNKEKLQELHIDLTPAVSRCTIQLQDLETSLPAYRLEV